jgi:hypothetical protein
MENIEMNENKSSADTYTVSNENAEKRIENLTQYEAKLRSYLQDNATFIERTTKPPFLFMETKRETYGKRKGWNPCINSKNQIYYSGWAFANADEFLEYKKLK